MASLLVGMTRNDVMMNIRGGATCNNNKQSNVFHGHRSVFHEFTIVQWPIEQ